MATVAGPARIIEDAVVGKTLAGRNRCRLTV
jgi:hypothetical protein